MEEKQACIRRELDGVFREWSAGAAFTGAAIFLLLSPLDFYAVPAHAPRFLVYRLAVAALLGVSGAFLRRPRSRATAQGTVFLCVLASAAVLEAMILDFGGHSSPYLIGLILLAVTVLGLIPAGPAFASVLAGTIFAVYLVPLLAWDTFLEPGFFAVGAALFAAILVTGVLINWMHLRRLAHETSMRYDLTVSRERLEEEAKQRARADAEQARGEERLRLFAAAVEGAAEGFYIVGLDGRILYVNPAVRAISGREPSSYIGRQVTELHANPAQATDVIMPAIMRSGSWAGEVSGRTADGQPLAIWLTASLVRDDAGRPIAMVGVTKDLTEQRRLEEERVRAQKLESIGVLAGGLAHDFNNLLTIILGNLDLARLFAGANPEVVEALDHAGEAALRAGDLTRQLITFSKGGQPVTRVGDIVRTVRETVAFAAAGSNVTCAYELADDLPAVDFDEGQMRQVIHNLVQNAREAMPAGGTLQVCASALQVGEREVHGLQAGRYLCLQFRDRGSGIARAHLPLIFDPYFSTKEMDTVKGRGLGLAVSFSIVRNHGGTMTADSSVAEGTTISVYLPESRRAAETAGAESGGGSAPAAASAAPAAVPGALPELLPAGAAKGRVLVMDDEQLVLEMAGAVLRRLGYAATLARSAAEAVVQYQIGLDTGRRFDAVILDLTVAGGPGGTETLARLREIDPAVRAALSSGYVDHPAVADWPAAGFAAFIAKPYSIKSFEEALARLL
jgi:PAS domain S-box-containing protein